MQITALDLVDELITLHVVSTTPEAGCPCCLQVACRVHSRYTRTVADVACAGHRIQLILHVRKFFCPNPDCARKIFTERLSPFVEPWARMTTRLSQMIEAIGLATCARLGTRLGLRLGIETSRMSILRRIMKLAIPSAVTVSCLGLDDFSFQRGRTFGTVLVDLERHQMVDLLPDRQTETAAAWMRRHPEIQYVSRDGGSEYAAAATQGAPQAIQVMDRFHICENLAQAVQLLLARVLTEMKERELTETDGQPAEHALPLEEWRPAQDPSVKLAIATRRGERQARYLQVVGLREQGLTCKQIAAHLRMAQRTVRQWLQRGIAPDVRPRRKYHSDFDAYAPYVLKRWQEGCHSGMDLWREIVAQGYPGSHRMVYRFLEPLKAGQPVSLTQPQRLPQYTSKAAVWLFMRQFTDLDEAEQEDLEVFCQASLVLKTTSHLVQDFLQMVRQRAGNQLEAWLTQARSSKIPELQSFVHGVELDKAAVQAGLTLEINNGQVEGHVTKIKLIKRTMYGRAGFPLLRQRVLHAL